MSIYVCFYFGNISQKKGTDESRKKRILFKKMRRK